MFSYLLVTSVYCGWCYFLLVCFLILICLVVILINDSLLNGILFYFDAWFVFIMFVVSVL